MVKIEDEPKKLRIKKCHKKSGIALKHSVYSKAGNNISQGNLATHMVGLQQSPHANYG